MLHTFSFAQLCVGWPSCHKFLAAMLILAAAGGVTCYFALHRWLMRRCLARRWQVLASKFCMRNVYTFHDHQTSKHASNMHASYATCSVPGIAHICTGEQRRALVPFLGQHHSCEISAKMLGDMILHLQRTKPLHKGQGPWGHEIRPGLTLPSEAARKLVNSVFFPR